MIRAEVLQLMLNAPPDPRLDFHLPAALLQKDDVSACEGYRAHVQVFGGHPFVTLWLPSRDRPYVPVARNGRDMEATFTDRALQHARPPPELRHRLRAADVAAIAFDEHGRPLDAGQESHLRTDCLVEARVLPDDHAAVSAIEGSDRVQLGLIAACTVRRGDYITLYSRGAFVALSDEPESACPDGFEYALEEPLAGGARLLVLGNPLESLGCFANRAPRPNAHICRVWLRTPCDGFQLHFALRAERDIARGREIALSYGRTWHDDHLVRTQLSRCSARRIADKAYYNDTLLRVRKLDQKYKKFRRIATTTQMDEADRKALLRALDEATRSFNAVIANRFRATRTTAG